MLVRTLTAIAATICLLSLAACGGGGIGPITTPQIPGGSDQLPTPIHSTWWLPDNTRDLVRGSSPTITTQGIPQKLVNTNANGRSIVRNDGFGMRFDGALIENAAAVSILTSGIAPQVPWDNRAVTNFGGVTFAESRSSTGSTARGLEINRVVGFLDYGSFSIWREEILGPAIGAGCCRWAIANHASIASYDSTKYLSLGKYQWNGAMVGAVKVDPQQTILGNAQLTLNVNTLGEAEPTNTVNVVFSNVRNLANGNSIPDMHWRINEIGGHCTGGFCLRSGAHMDTGLGSGTLVSGSGHIAAQWTGPGHANVVGTYNTDRYLGAFGGTRQ